jgi:hypothetical protein
MNYQVQANIFEYVKPEQNRGVIGGVVIGTVLPVERIVEVIVSAQPEPDQYVVSDGRFYPLRVNSHVYGVIS